MFDQTDIWERLMAYPNEQQQGSNSFQYQYTIVT